ncbi:NAD(P)H-dependent oxidoreductase [Rhodococcus sp. IEGM 1354]|uniref:NADPH-dependent FMN reductase n=1 Tax=Rhodococcus sp. IEGM 1354 TaxID=3047088 RepID=UPI0024B722FC|nr:NAD(P)H-dependent oxidoreductase [Rhodococcus sp. IEGM 1354]MDI9933642.1 NAD(P)H-dependent oxidoreductase [Rhodococcus sp. IEGM 1354]
MSVTVVVGNPKPGSHTRRAAEMLAEQLSGREADETIELSELGPKLLGWGDPDVSETKDRTASSRLVIFASPTFKATYSGLLKLFLEQFSGGTGLEHIVAVPLMLGGGPTHALAPELTLRPVLAELGATCTSGLYLLDSSFDDGVVIGEYADRWRPMVQALFQGN